MNTSLLFHRIRRALGIIRRGGLSALKARIFGPDYSSDYQDWIREYDTLTEEDRRLIRQRIENIPGKPLISVVMAAHNTPARWLRAAIESVRAQIYPDWELCIADDASRQLHVRQILEDYQRRDSRIKTTFRKEAGHISAAMNSALALASGEYVVFLDHDDELSEHALYLIAEEIAACPQAGLIYTDEDKIRDGSRRFHPNFKPDWNPELLLAQNYICHLCAMQRTLVQEAGGFRSGLEGAQDWDLILRVSEKLGAEQIRHIPHIAYHWRVIDGSTAQSVSFKPYVFSAQASTVREHLKRRGVTGAGVEIHEDSSRIRVRFPLPVEPPLVSIALAVPENPGTLMRCLKSLCEKTDYPAFEILLIDQGVMKEEGRQYLDSLRSDARMRILVSEDNTSIPAAYNLAATQSRGEILAFLGNDLEVISKDWLSDLVSYALRSEIGAVGARIIYSNNLLQHAGLILGAGLAAASSHKRLSRHHPGYFDRAILPQNLSAVSGACMVMRREVFEQAGGFDAQDLTAAFSDVDLCLKLRRLGYLIAYNPYAQLYCFAEGNRYFDYSTGKAQALKKEIGLLKARWEKELRADPYYNLNLNSLAADFTLAYPPRSQKPWMT